MYEGMNAETTTSGSEVEGAGRGASLRAKKKAATRRGSFVGGGGFKEQAVDE